MGFRILLFEFAMMFLAYIACFYRCYEADLFKQFLVLPSELQTYSFTCGAVMALAFCFRDWFLFKVFKKCFKWIKSKNKKINRGV